MDTIKNLCEHCDPYQDDSAHTSEKFDLYIAPITNFCSSLANVLQRFPKLNSTLNKVILNGVLKTFLALNILQEVEAQDNDGELYNRSLVVVREARKRGIAIKALKCFGKGTNHYSIEVDGEKSFYEALPCLPVGHIASIDVDNKGVLKKLLEQAELPHPKGQVFGEYVAALQYVKAEIGYPVVVKPESGSLSRHTTCNIKNDDELREAITIAKMISKDFVVEERIEGDVQRITVVGGEVVAACFRETPNVIGDGVHTVQELIETKNQNPLRGEAHQRNFTLHRIVVSPRTLTKLASQNVHLESVLEKGQKVYLHNKHLLTGGGDLHDTTEQIHPENIKMFKKVFELCQVPIIGIDFITKDLSRPHYEQKCAVIEVNSLPYIDLHHYPVTGQIRNVAGSILDYYLSQK